MRDNCTQILAWDVGLWSWEFDFEREGYSQELGEILVLTCVRYNFSPTDYTDNTDSFFFFFDALFDCVKCALRIYTDFCLAAFLFLDMKT